MIQFFSEDDVKTREALKAWAEVSNNHIDDVLYDQESISNVGIMYRTLSLLPKNSDYYIVQCYVIWDKQAGKVWIIHDSDGPVKSYTEKAYFLKKYAVAQWKKLIEKRT